MRVFGMAALRLAMAPEKQAASDHEALASTRHIERTSIVVRRARSNDFRLVARRATVNQSAR